MEENREEARISPGKDDEFRYFQRQYAASAAVDRLIDATEPDLHATDSLAINQFSEAAGATDTALSGASDSVENEEVPEAMWTHEYVAEKTRELESEELDRALQNNQYARETRGPGAFTRLVAATGRSLRRAGERLESWGTLEDQDDCVSC